MTEAKEPEAPPARLLRIHEAAAEVGLTARSVRYYEEVGLLRPAARWRRSPSCWRARLLANGVTPRSTPRTIRLSASGSCASELPASIARSRLWSSRSAVSRRWWTRPRAVAPELSPRSPSSDRANREEPGPSCRKSGPRELPLVGPGRDKHRC